MDNFDRIDELAEHLVESHSNLLDELVLIRKQNRLTQEEVAERLGISQPAIAAFESEDSNPTLSSIRRYALAIGARIFHTVSNDLAVVEEVERGHAEISIWISQQVPYSEVTFSPARFSNSNGD